MHGSKLKDQRTETVACFESETHSISQSKTRPILRAWWPSPILPVPALRSHQDTATRQTQTDPARWLEPWSTGIRQLFLWDMKSGNMMLEKSRTEVLGFWWLLYSWIRLNSETRRLHWDLPYLLTSCFSCHGVSKTWETPLRNLHHP